MSRTTNETAAFLALGILVGTPLLGCRPEGATLSAGGPVPVTLALVTEEATSGGRSVPGVVRSETRSPLSARIVGSVKRVLVSEGDRVRRGQLLILLDGREVIAAARRGASGSEEAARALLGAGAAVRAAEADAALAEATFRRFSALAERGAVSGQELDETRARRDTAAAEADRARQARAQAEAGRDGASAAADQSAALASYAEIRSPIDGIVTSRQIDPGALIAPGVPLLVVEDDRNVRVETTVDESIPVRKGDPVVVEIGTARIDAKVTRLQPSLDPSAQTARVEILLPAPARTGTFARVRFAGVDRSALHVPRAAVSSRGALRFVHVVGEDSVARMRLVTLGAARGDLVEVLTGLSAGERVVVGAPAGLTDGVRVSAARG